MDTMCWVDNFKTYAMAFVIAFSSVWGFLYVVFYKYEQELAQFLLKLLKKYESTT